MDTKRQPAPLIVIIGPTASGKSALALELARKYHGEIISADSRTVYRGMDIGTAKPTTQEQTEIRHHVIDVVNPDQSFTAAEFKRQALIWIDDITIRGRVPIMAGGTGLYIDGVVYDFAFLPSVPPEERAELEALTVDQLQAAITERGITMPQNSKNRRHLIRALETNGAIPVKKNIRANTLLLGFDISKHELEKRIDRRIDQMISRGLQEEVKKLADKYSWEAPGMTGVGYREWKDYFNNKLTLEETRELIRKNTVQYAKRQRTWFKRNDSIHWIKNAAEANRLVKEFLQKSR